LKICDDVRLWRSHDGETFGSVSVGRHVEHYPVRSRSFRDWLLGQTARRFRNNGRPASVGETAFRDALMAIEARAHVDGVRWDAPLRVAEHKDGIYIDRGTPDWSVIHVSRWGRSIIAEAPVPILRSRRTAPISSLPAEGSFDGLLRLLGNDDESNCLFIAWCVAALMPRGPYPMLIVGGEAGSGKSTFCRLAQRLVDPTAGDLLQPPRDDRDLIAAARHGSPVPRRVRDPGTGAQRPLTPKGHRRFNFNRPEELPRDLSEKLLAVYEPLLVFQNRLTQQAATFTNDSQGRRARPQLIQYPRGGGMFGRHLHTLEPQRIGLILGLSQRGVDFQSGGTHFDVEGTDVSSEDAHDIGDMLLFRFDIPHWITPVDMSQPCDFSLASGRWTAVLPYR
jgi:hypothetical protein